MRAEKKLLTSEYVARLNASPFFIVAGYQGLKVAHMSELRKRLALAGAEIHVVKNTVFNVAAKEAGHGDDWPDRVPALADLEPASLVVDDPDRRARDQLGCSVDHGPLLASWEHASLVARPLFVRTAAI